MTDYDALCAARAELAKVREESEQLCVQLAGCMTAALGIGMDRPARRGNYGWSSSYEDVLTLRKERDELTQRVALLEAKIAEMRTALRLTNAARHDFEMASEHKQWCNVLNGKENCGCGMSELRNNSREAASKARAALDLV